MGRWDYEQQHLHAEPDRGYETMGLWDYGGYWQQHLHAKSRRGYGTAGLWGGGSMGLRRTMGL